MTATLTLRVLPGTYAVCRLPATAAIPAWASAAPADPGSSAMAADFISITRTRDELSIVCIDSLAAPHLAAANGGALSPHESATELRAERDWRMLKVEGTLDFSLTGILAAITKPLAEAKISVFAISTFDTDYLLVRSASLEPATACLRTAGYIIA